MSDNNIINDTRLPDEVEEQMAPIGRSGNLPRFGVTAH